MAAVPQISDAEGRVLDVVRALAQETGGERARRAVSRTSSLEREVGLGSLERVELLLRLERAFGRSLGDDFLTLDTPGELAERLALSPLPAAALEPAAQSPALPDATSMPPGAQTLHEILAQRAEREPGRTHAYLRQADTPEEAVSYGALARAAARVAGGLRERGVGPGDRVALMLPTGIEFLETFLGTLTAGAVPVPLYPPARLDQLEDYASRQREILKDSGARLLVTFSRALPVAELLRTAAALVTARDLEGPHLLEQRSGADPALIQYTSGSTGHPKGVLLTHSNLLANIQAIATGLSTEPSDVGVSWLPLYHDMGLIGSWLFCLVQGYPITLLPPTSFLARPERWLQAIHSHRATLSAAPNFAYELCVRAVPDSVLEGLDLGSWRCALNGSEPVNPATIERFSKRFSKCGFRPEALLPVYGLAECSVALCFPPPLRGTRIDRVEREAFASEGLAKRADPDDPNALVFPSVGFPLPLHEVRIVARNGEDLPERHLGRLLFQGPSRTPGYFGQPETTAALMEGDFMDSGDLAYRADGEIYIAGRSKDIIIKAGRNLVPQEIEELAAGVPGVRRGSVAAFGVPSEAHGTETLVLVAESRRPGDALESRVRETVAAGIGIPLDIVRLVPPGSVPKTSSGKVRRAATRELFLSGALGQAPSLSVPTRLRLALHALRGSVRGLAERGARLAYAGYLAGCLALGGLVLYPFALIFTGRRHAEFLQGLAVRFVMLASFCRLEVEGLEHLSGEGPFLLVCNHASYVDVPALLRLLPIGFLFVAKAEVNSWPLAGLFVRRVGHLTVDRYDSEKSLAAAEGVTRAIRESRSVLVFPEGTFTSSPGLRSFRLGAFATAVQTDTAVIPLALEGTRRVLRGGSWLPWPGRISLWVGPPLRPEAGDSWRAAVALRDKARELIAAHCGEPSLDILSAAVPKW